MEGLNKRKSLIFILYAGEQNGEKTHKKTIFKGRKILTWEKLRIVGECSMIMIGMKLVMIILLHYE